MNSLCTGMDSFLLVNLNPWYTQGKVPRMQHNSHPNHLVIKSLQKNHALLSYSDKAASS